MARDTATKISLSAVRIRVSADLCAGHFLLSQAFKSPQSPKPNSDCLREEFVSKRQMSPVDFLII